MVPDQQVALALPWERGALSDPSLSATRLDAVRAQKSTAPRQPDAFSGLIIGPYTVLSRLTENTQRSLIAVRRVEDEPRALVVLRRLDHPDVPADDVRAMADWSSQLPVSGFVKVFPVEEDASGLYWVTELPTGATFAELSAATRRTGQAMPLGLVLGSVVEAARALGELHARGGVHGLVREQSILIGFDGVTRLLDMGLLRCAGQGQTWFELAETMAPSFAPEQLTENRPADARTDVFSLAAVLYEGLTRTPVRRGARTFDQHMRGALDGQLVPPSKLNVTVPPAVDQVLAKALSADRTQRYATGRELANALSEAAGHFVWRKDLRAQFVAKNFEARQREETVLRGVMEKLPELKDLEPDPEPEPELNFEAAPDVLPPAELMEGLTPMPPPARDVEVAPVMPLPAAPAAPVVKPPPKWLMPVGAGVGGLVLGVILSVALYKPPPPPPPPLPPIQWATDVADEAVRVEVVADLQQCLAEVSEVPAPPLTEKDLETNESRAAKVQKKKRDNVPIPPWLRKRH